MDIDEPLTPQRPATGVAEGESRMCQLRIRPWTDAEFGAAMSLQPPLPPRPDGEPSAPHNALSREDLTRCDLLARQA